MKGKGYQGEKLRKTRLCCVSRPRRRRRCLAAESRCDIVYRASDAAQPAICHIGIRQTRRTQERTVPDINKKSLVQLRKIIKTCLQGGNKAGPPSQQGGDRRAFQNGYRRAASQSHPAGILRVFYPGRFSASEIRDCSFLGTGLNLTPFATGRTPCASHLTALRSQFRHSPSGCNTSV
ncbi:hypothetical protein VTN96DRAFT_4268 [Rasamsonia emersonii]